MNQTYLLFDIFPFLHPHLNKGPVKWFQRFPYEVIYDSHTFRAEHVLLHLIHAHRGRNTNKSFSTFQQNPRILMSLSRIQEQYYHAFQSR